MKRWNNERGGGWALVFWLVVLAAFVYFGSKFLPTYVSSNQFYDAMEYEAKETAAGNRTDEQVRKALVIKAKELGLPILAANIQITRSGNEVAIQVKYTVSVDLPYTAPVQWKFSPRSAKPMLN